MILGLSNPCDDDIGNSCFGGEEVDGRIARVIVKKQLLRRKFGEHAEVGMSETMVVKNGWVGELTAGA
ncbi:hypothetical protein CLOM_g15922 [Closterium sp. NIES-68]|nr:hypothetical protein CLOM_g15922 [Closterium sp. NIES-68]